MDVEVDRAPSRSVVRVRGEIDIASAPSLMEALDPLVEAGAELVVDMSEVTFCDSSGLSVLVQCRERANGSGAGPLRLVITRPSITRVFEVTGLDQVFEIYASLDDAAAGR
jgi:anti-sigma B factor antagonist